MSIFKLSQDLIGDYAGYVQSFLTIADPQIREFVEQELVERGRLWPEPLMQLNPAYAPGRPVSDLPLHPACAPIFYDERRKQPVRLYRHQEEAIERALRRQPYVVTSGTGSGKTLTYFVPIFNAVLSERPAEARVRAIVVYPMNALVNSQLEALQRLADSYQRRTGSTMPVRFARYTGQEREATKEDIRKDPPHILLTNYVMLELMLVRPEERTFIDATTTGIEFLVLDELHTYRGRQGADVALLVRRLRERCGNPNLQCVGTSATMVAGKALDARQRREAVAEFAGKVFGVPVHPDNVVEESLRRITLVPHASCGTPAAPPATEPALREALGQPAPATAEAFLANPLTAWIEDTFGIQAESDGTLRRRTPLGLAAGAGQLAELAGVDAATCRSRLEEMFTRGARLSVGDGPPLFAFKLHHFISQGRAVYATLEPPAARTLTMEGQYYASDASRQRDRILFPLTFCRACGQEYYAVLRQGTELGGQLVPWEPETEVLLAVEGVAGYLMPAREGAETDWDAEHLPAEWLDAKGRVKKSVSEHVPQAVWVRPDGTLAAGPASDATAAWFQPKPFMLCLNCGELYTRRDKNDFRKLGRLSSEGRSTATTVLSVSSLLHAGSGGIVEAARKILSFTDNRQDASLQAGHFNDFVQVSLLRAAVYVALQGNGQLQHDTIALKAVEALGLSLADIALNRQLDSGSPMANKVWQAFRDLVAYRAYEDLRRGWRVVQPNLEQCGLLRVGYDGLDALCADDSKWQALEPLRRLPAAARRKIVQALLDHFRKKLAIRAPELEPEAQETLIKNVQQLLGEPWGFGDEPPRPAERFWLDGAPGPGQGFSLGPASLLGRYLCHELGLPNRDAYQQLIGPLIDRLCGWGLLISGTEKDARFVQLDAAALLWLPGDGTPPPPDPIYSRRAQSSAYAEAKASANVFFRDFYTSSALRLKGIEGREHTAQVSTEDRQERERRFSRGELKCLFCSPTMELGIDIQDLQLVHLRNVPPTPANYAQRSGRAGRGSEPALVMTYCTARSGHDQYYFHRREQMVAGAVRAPRLDLGNEDLLRAHIHAVWLAKVGLSLRTSVADSIGLAQEGYPLQDNVAAQIQLSEARLHECQQEVERILATCYADLVQAGWYVDGGQEWLSAVLRSAAQEFDRSFNRWRELYRTADQQWDEANKTLRLPVRDREERRIAERRRAEAERQKNLLCNYGTSAEESDFYPYRYLASEGFLPGYNFPRLPIRAFIPRGEGEFVARPRFLALREFGPQNIIYHEGAKYQAGALMAPPGGLAQRRTQARLCNTCGYYHADAAVDLCDNCRTRLDATNSEVMPLLEMCNVRTWRREHITCDEEERRRQGYRLSTHFRFAPAPGGRLQVHEALVTANPRAGTGEVPPGGRGDFAVQSGGDYRDEVPLLRLCYAPAATVYTVNRGWLNARQQGFGLDLISGQWRGHADDGSAGDDVPPPVDAKQVETVTVCPFVSDTQNILLVSVLDPQLAANESWLASLQAALRRGIEVTFQIEESEIAAERIGAEDRRAILFSEVAEGGVGVLRRLVEERDALAQVAAEAVKRLHFDAGTLQDTEADCARACYDCLLSYTNQWDHLRLDRHLVGAFLAQLKTSVALPQAEGRSYEEHYAWLRSFTDVRSELERRFLDQLYRTRRRLPDDAQRTLIDFACVPDFFYEPDVCVFCDGSVHDSSQQQAEDAALRGELRERGYRVVVIRYDCDLEEQIARHADVFGTAAGVS